MKILSIETSCDETAVALLEIEGGFDNAKVHVLGNALLSQIDIHKEYGGVYPNLAKREHQKNLIPLLKKVLKEANASEARSENLKYTGIDKILEREPELLKQFTEFIPTIEVPDIDLIAVTSGPGLEPALWVGINFAKALGEVWSVPVVAVDHMEGHIVSALLKKIPNSQFLISNIQFPILALLISGGHTELVLMHDFGEYEILGETLDDAVGEAFDKVARMLELPYPGGPEISRLAEEARENSADSPYPLPRPMMHSDDFNFSFSGLKTAVLYTLKKVPILTPGVAQQIAKEFEEAATDVLIHKTYRALDEYGVKALLVGGGVSANKHIRECMQKMVEIEFPHIEVLFPDGSLTGDNAIMIGVAAYFRARKSVKKKEIVAAGNQRL